MRGSRFAIPLHTEALYPNNGLPPRPGEDRPGLSPFGRLAMGGQIGKSSILIYDHRGDDVQNAETDMIGIQGDDLDAQQLILTLHPPRVIPLPFEEVCARLDQQNLTGEQSNADASVRWPPLEALVEFGVGGVNTKVVVDFVNGVTFSVTASFLRVGGLVTQSRHLGDIYGTSAAYYLAANVGPGFAGFHAQRTVFVGHLDTNHESCVFDLPRMAKIAALAGSRKHHKDSPTQTIGWIRFWQDAKGEHGVGDYLLSSPQQRVEIPNAAMYFSVVNLACHELKMSSIFTLAL
jgi:hypothetical protein